MFGLGRTFLVLKSYTECLKSLRTLQHRLVHFASTTCAPSGSLCDTFLDIVPIPGKLSVQHLFRIVTLLLRLLNLFFLLQLNLWLLELLLDLMTRGLHVQLCLLFLALLVSFLKHFLHSFLFIGRLWAIFLVIRWLSVIFIIFKCHFVQSFDLGWIHQLV